MSKKDNILVIDDTRENLTFLCKLLQEEAYNTFPAESGEQAMSYLENNIPDIILLDIKMPEMDGFEVCKQIKNNKKLTEIPIIFITAGSEINDKLEGFRLGAADFITKPFHKGELLARLKTHIALQHKKIELKREKDLAQKYLDVAGVMFIVLNRKGEITTINKKGCEILGYSYNEIINKNWFNICLPNNIREKIWTVFQELMEGNIKIVEYYENDVLTKNNEIKIIAFHNTIIRDDNSKIISVLFSGEDITIRKQEEQELIIAKEKIEEKKIKLKEQARLLDLIFTHSLDSIVLLDKDYNFIQVSETYARSCQKDISYFPGKNHFDLYPSDFKDELDEYKQNKQTYYRHARPFIFPDHPEWGTTYWNLGLVPILDKNDEIELFIFTLKNITEKHKTEQELIVAKAKAEESDQLKTEFINNMSHEIRTPMNGILGFSNFLNKPNLTDKKRKYYISIIQNNGKQLMRIIDDILEISKLGTKQVKTIETNIILNDVFLELFSIFNVKAKEQKIPLYLKKGLPDNDSEIFTDKSKLNIILSNLLENALKFTNTGFIEFGYKLNTDIERGITEQSRSIEIYVKDTGIGIEPESQEIIFERFSQEKKELSQKVGGLGLGLSIAKENAELLGGKITLKSEKDKGATFFVTIPYKKVNTKQEKNSDQISPIVNSKSSIEKYTILIVEDEEVNYLYLDTLLEDFELNIKTLHAKHGQEAVKICMNNSEIDLVLMDLKMPIMNGFEATKLIKVFRPNLPIVAQTAYSTGEEKGQAISAGCDDFISKPISEETLNETIVKYLIIK